MDSGDPRPSASAGFAGAQTRLLLCKCLQTMDTGSVAPASDFAIAQTQQLYGKPLQVVYRVGVVIAASAGHVSGQTQLLLRKSGQANEGRGHWGIQATARLAGDQNQLLLCMCL